MCGAIPIFLNRGAPPPLTPQKSNFSFIVRFLRNLKQHFHMLPIIIDIEIFKWVSLPTYHPYKSPIDL